MYFQGFAIEILEDGKLLREYCLQAKNTKIITGKSYIVDDGQTNERKYSPITTYAVVKELGKKFEIKYSAKIASEDNPIIAIIYIDGSNDYIHHGLTSPSPQILDFFWDSSRSKRYYFEFSEVQSAVSSPKSCIRTKPLYGGIGTVSIYFYKGLKLSKESMSIPYYALSQSKMIEPKFRSEINFTTKFNEVVDANISTICNVDMIKQSNDPIAVLHIHYRSEPWLISIGMPIRNHDNSLTECTPNNNSPKPIPIVNGNELILQNEPVTAKMDVINDQIDNAANQLNQSLDILIQSFKKMNNNMNLNNDNTTSVDVIEILDEGEKIHEKCNEHNGETPKNADEHKNRNKRSRRLEEYGFREQPNNKRKRRNKRTRRKKQKIVVNIPKLKELRVIEKESIPEVVKKEKQENLDLEQATTKTPKYKEYIEREYHTSDYIEFDDEQDQILKQKTYCIEKMIIDLEETEDE